MKIFVLIVLLSILGCSNNPANSPQSRHFDLRPELLAQDRYECSKAGADQACIDRGFTSSTTRDGCETVNNVQYLSGMTCVNE